MISPYNGLVEILSTASLVIFSSRCLMGFRSFASRAIVHPIIGMCYEWPFFPIVTCSSVLFRAHLTGIHSHQVKHMRMAKATVPGLQSTS